MNKLDFINLAYFYFPKNLVPDESKKYSNSKEFKRLKEVLNNNQNNEKILNLIDEFKKNIFFNEINDMSILDWQDRCFSFELDIFEENKLIKFCINISLLTNHFSIYILENEISIEPYKWLTLPKRNKEIEIKYDNEIEFIVKIIEANIGYKKFPENLSDIILNDICFGNVELGKFTLYNAFFLDEDKTK